MRAKNLVLNVNIMGLVFVKVTNSARGVCIEQEMQSSEVGNSCRCTNLFVSNFTLVREGLPWLPG